MRSHSPSPRQANLDPPFPVRHALPVLRSADKPLLAAHLRDAATDDDDHSVPGAGDGSSASTHLHPPSLAGESEAARCLVVVFIDPPDALLPSTVAVCDAMLDAAPHLKFEPVGSSIGAMYLRFNSHADREEAMALRELWYEEARISFEREEEAGRVPSQARTLALISASRFPAEHVNSLGIAYAFASFGKVVEIDPVVLAGHDLTTVRAIVLVNHARDIPCNVWPLGGHSGDRVITIRTISIWDSAESYTATGEYRPCFGPPPPPPFAHNSPPAAPHGCPLGWPAPANLPHQLRGPRNDRGGGRQPRPWCQLHLLLRLLGAPPLPRSPPLVIVNDVGPPPSPASEASTFSSSSSVSHVFSDVTDASPRRPCGVVVTEIVDEPLRPPPTICVAPLPPPPPVSSVVCDEEPSDLACCKTKACARHGNFGLARRHSHRLGLKEPPEHVDKVTKAIKRRDLRDSLKGCSPRLQQRAAKAIGAVLKPLRLAAVRDLRSATAMPAAPVPTIGDD